MPLHILGILVVGGIAGVAVLLHLLGLSRVRRFGDEAAARAAWAAEFPDIPANRAVLCRNRAAALIETPQGPGVVWPMGADSTARFLTGARIARSRDGLTIRLPDYTAPRIRLTLDPDEAEAWLTDLEKTA
ncbi:hypothetical protein SAMN05216196_101809 [Lutimaribacter pacificus]|uniref:Uncharacterized protein n=1 Tax=Lutimaribacter pacificus TaxID=391948 RepID=A0A1H0C523_9RHOB|nr:hypothetical protein [Lutimaribacter pacificus]SDN52942.1 hypothetical protein SAMN05216196_101809 [Lutimaribacter pacificus]SHJ48681.1 hypothetical protein SAMN05444142_101408 [Lutimaribacter pacificus]